jgi:hypothetical protein
MRRQRADPEGSKGIAAGATHGEVIRHPSPTLKGSNCKRQGRRVISNMREQRKLTACATSEVL